MTEDGGYESHDEYDLNVQVDYGYIEYPDIGETFVTMCVLTEMVQPVETIQRDNISTLVAPLKARYATLCFTNVSSTHVVEKLGLEKTRHPHPYRFRWLDDKVNFKIQDQVTINPFKIGKYQYEVVCGVVPMQE